MGTYEDAGIFLGPDSTDSTAELRARNDAQAHRILVEAIGKAPPRNPHLERAVEGIVRTLDAIHERENAADAPAPNGSRSPAPGRAGARGGFGGAA